MLFRSFYIGISDGNKKKDYKFISENILENNEEIDQKYIFERENQKQRIYPILYENRDSYIVSFLSHEKNENNIETNHQKIVSKKGIETEYSEDIFSLCQEEKSIIIDKSEEEQNTNGENVMVNFGAGIIVGGLLVFLVMRDCRKREKVLIESKAASLLYYDLVYIEKYISSEKELINLRYSDAWQRMLMNCSFLDDESIMLLYEIYEAVYNYNNAFSYRLSQNKKFKKEKLSSFTELKKLLFELPQSDKENEHNKYEILLGKLRKKAELNKVE